MTQQVKRTRDSENPILTISAKNGWMDQKDRFNRVIAGKELKNYIELYENELSYNHGNSKYAKFGIIYVQRKYKKALVPKVYHSFSMTNGDPRFIENLSLGHKLDKELSKLITSGARQDGLLNINKNSFYSIKLFIPSEQEQIKISNIMDILNHIITLYERKIKLFSQLKKYFLDNLFTEKEYPDLRFKGFTDAWEQRKLGEISYIKGRIGWKSLKQSEYVEKGPALIASKHISNGKVNWTSVDHIPDWRYEESPEIMLELNDIIFSKDGSIGNPAVITSLPNKATINSTMMLVRLDKNILSAGFFYQILASNQFKKLVFEKTSGSSIPHIFQNDMKKFKFYFPQQGEQIKISNMLNILDNLIVLYENKQQHLTEIKKTLLNTMFI